jgi:membrane protease YdiL (CAAX protease family)
VTKRRRTGTQSKKRSGTFALDPLFSCLIFAGVGVGTLGMKASPRLAVLWVSLLILWILHREGQALKLKYEYVEIGRGLLAGLAVGVPLLLLSLRSLATAIPILFVGAQQTSLERGIGTTVFLTVVLLAPLAEELFFRDILQREQGLWVTIALYAAAGLVLFIPTTGQSLVVLLSVVGVWSVLGTMYAFSYERFGFTATLTAHVVINLFLLYVPAILFYLGLLAE